MTELVSPKRLITIVKTIEDFTRCNYSNSEARIIFQKECFNNFFKSARLLEGLYRHSRNKQYREGLSKLKCFENVKLAVINLIEGLDADPLDILRNWLEQRGLILIQNSEQYMIRNLRNYVENYKKRIFNVSDHKIITKCDAALLLLDLGICHISDDIENA